MKKTTSEGMMEHRDSLDTVCGAFAYALGIEPPSQAALKNQRLCAYLDEAFGKEKAQRVFLYHPDAVAQWIFEKYGADFMPEVTARCDFSLPLCAVMPSVTPVCFGTIYTGAQPCVHGIQKYEKPTITIDTLFDALLRAGKKCAIVSYGNSSIHNIYRDRDMDYFVYPTIEEANAKAARLILEDRHDLIAVYNGNYDSRMHKTGCESKQSLAELRCNSRAFGLFYEMIKENWAHHNTLIGFAMDHGCHDIDEGAGSHGLDMDEDLHIVHLYKAMKKGVC